VLVAAVGSADCPAARALLTEGVACEVAVMTDVADYPDAVRGVWGLGRGFVLVEHDVVPWPGATSQLVDCPERWCAFEYPLAPGCLSHALGCVKVAAGTDPPSVWPSSWRELDACVYRHLGMPHLHSPPVAHAKHHGIICR
jgi:hypothetical protein